MSAPAPLKSRLGRVIKDFMLPGHSRDHLTVLSAENDPYRCDAPAQVAGAKWFAAQYERFYGARGRTCHIRGLHYKVVACGDILTPRGGGFTRTRRTTGSGFAT